MTRRTPRATALLAAAALTLTLAACGDSGENTTDVESPASASATAESSADASASASADASASITDGATDGAAPSDGATSGEVSLKDGSAALTLPAGFVTAPDDISIVGTEQPAAQGSSMAFLLHAVPEGTDASTPVGDAIMVQSMTPQQPVEESIVQGQEAASAGQPGVTQEMGEPYSLEFGGEAGQAVPFTITPDANPETPTYGAMAFVNHADTSYALILSGTDQAAITAQIEEMAGSWTWAD